MTGDKLDILRLVDEIYIEEIRRAGLYDDIWQAFAVLLLSLIHIFVLMRFGQAYVHTTSNVVLRRGTFYVVGALVLIIMWVIFMIRILLGLP